jgi:hypothetical protein
MCRKMKGRAKNLRDQLMPPPDEGLDKPAIPVAVRPELIAGGLQAAVKNCRRHSIQRMN